MMSPLGIVCRRLLLGVATVLLLAGPASALVIVAHDNGANPQWDPEVEQGASFAGRVDPVADISPSAALFTVPQPPDAVIDGLDTPERYQAYRNTLVETLLPRLQAALDQGLDRFELQHVQNLAGDDLHQPAIYRLLSERYLNWWSRRIGWLAGESAPVERPVDWSLLDDRAARAHARATLSAAAYFEAIAMATERLDRAAGSRRVALIADMASTGASAFAHSAVALAPHAGVFDEVRITHGRAPAAAIVDMLSRFPAEKLTLVVPLGHGQDPPALGSAPLASIANRHLAETVLREHPRVRLFFVEAEPFAARKPPARAVFGESPRLGGLQDNPKVNQDGQSLVYRVTYDPARQVFETSALGRMPNRELYDRVLTDRRFEAFNARPEVMAEREQQAEIRSRAVQALNEPPAAATPMPPRQGAETTLRFSYDTRGNLLSISDQSGTSETYRYDTANRLTAARLADGSIAARDYDLAGRLTLELTDFGVTRYEYDIHDRPIRIQEPGARTTLLEYDQGRLPQRLIEPSGQARELAWDRAGNLLSIRDVTGTTAYRYGSGGLLTQRIGSDGVTTRYEYDAVGRPTRILDTDPGGRLLAEVGLKYRGARLSAASVSYAFRGTRATDRADDDPADRVARSFLTDEEARRDRDDAGASRPAIRPGVGFGGPPRSPSRREPTGGSEQPIVVGDVRAAQGDQLPGRLLKVAAAHQRGHLVPVAQSYPPGQSMLTDGIPRPVSRARRPSERIGGKLPSGPGLDVMAPDSGDHRPRSDPVLAMGRVGNPSAPSASPGSGTPHTIRYEYDPAGKISEIVFADGEVWRHQYDAGGKLTAIHTSTGVTVTLPASWPREPTGGRIPGIGVGDVWHALSGNLTRPLFKAAAALPQHFVPAGRPYLMDGFNTIDMVSEPVNAATRWLGATGGKVLKGTGFFVAGLEAGRYLRGGDPVFAIGAAAKPFVGLATGQAAAITAGSLVAAGAPALLTVGGTVAVGASLRTMADLTLDIGTTYTAAWAMDRHTDQLRQRGLRHLIGQGADEARIRTFLLSTGLSERDIDADPRYRRERREDDPPLPGSIGGGPGGPPGPGGGPGGSPLSAPGVGGIALDRVATVLADLNDLVGVTYDPDSGEVILLGRTDTRLPPMNLDDLIVAIRIIYGGHEPSVSIEPCHPGRQDRCMKVIYDGHFQDPTRFRGCDQPDQHWLRHNPSGGLVVAEAPASACTRFGWVMFESDRFLKMATLGRDNLDPGQILRTAVPGFSNLLERMAGSASRPGSYEDCLIRSPADRNRPSNCQRLWFVPGQILVTPDGSARPAPIADPCETAAATASAALRLGMSPDRRSLAFEDAAPPPEGPPRLRFADATMLTQARYVRFDQAGRMVDTPGNDRAVDAFVAHFDRCYARFAAEKKELAELVQLAKIVALVRWLYERNVPIDTAWLDSHRVTPYDTPVTTPAIESRSGNLVLYGGVDLSGGQYRITPNSDAAARLASAALEARPSRAAASWDVPHAGETLTAIPIHLEPASVKGAFSIQRTDRARPESRLRPPAVARVYSSALPLIGPFGRGWQLATDRLDVRRIVLADDATEPDGPASANAATAPKADGARSQVYSTEMLLISGGDRASLRLTTDGLFRPMQAASPLEHLVESLGLTDGDDFTAYPLPDGLHVLPRRAGQAFRIESEDRRLQFDGFALRLTDGSVESFDRFGRLRGIQDPDGHRLTYVYVDDRLDSIRAADGQALHLQYDARGRVERLADARGDMVRRYGYDQAGNLTKVSDGEGRLLERYAYDADGRLSAVLDRLGNIRQRADYDALGRMIQATGPVGGRWTLGYEDASRSVIDQDPLGNAWRSVYDRAGRLTAFTAPDGGTSHWAYDGQGRLVAETDAAGGRTSYAYDAHGRLAERVDPSGARRQYLRDERGRLQALIDPLDRLHRIAYHPDGRVSTVTTGARVIDRTDSGYRYTEEALQTTTYQYDKLGQLIALVDPDGATMPLRYDDVGRVVGVGTAEAAGLDVAFDPRGRPTRARWTNGLELTYQYDQDDLLTGVRSPIGEVSFDYAEGRLVAVRDELGQHTHFAYDGDQRLATITDPSGDAVAIEYDAAGRPSRVRDSAGGIMTLAYDGVGRLLAVTSTSDDPDDTAIETGAGSESERPPKVPPIDEPEGSSLGWLQAPPQGGDASARIPDPAEPRAHRQGVGGAHAALTVVVLIVVAVLVGLLIVGGNRLRR